MTQRNLYYYLFNSLSINELIIIHLFYTLGKLCFTISLINLLPLPLHSSSYSHYLMTHQLTPITSSLINIPPLLVHSSTYPHYPFTNQLTPITPSLKRCTHYSFTHQLTPSTPSLINIPPLPLHSSTYPCYPIHSSTYPHYPFTYQLTPITLSLINIITKLEKMYYILNIKKAWKCILTIWVVICLILHNMPATNRLICLFHN